MANREKQTAGGRFGRHRLAGELLAFVFLSVVVLLTLWGLGYAALVELLGDGLGGWADAAHAAAVAPFEGLGLDGYPLLVVSALGCSAILFLGLKVVGLLVSLNKRWRAGGWQSETRYLDGACVGEL